jgi:hypothetical protein
MKPFLRYEHSGAVVTLTLDSPETRNVLTGNSAPDEFASACARINADPSVRVVILTGAGPAFSAGGNLKDMQQLFERTPVELREWYRNGVQRLALAVYNLEGTGDLRRQRPGHRRRLRPDDDVRHAHRLRQGELCRELPQGRPDSR